jgi:RHS repeat-associated protein
MQWDFKDQLNATSRQVVNATPPPDKVPETTFYVYDAGGQRARKITERQNGTRRNERFYLGGFEIYREFDTGNAVALERETLHVMDDKQRIALIETQTIDNGTAVASPMPVQRYQLGNHLGSASLELDEAGGLISYEEYSPYGSTTYQARSAAEVGLKRYRYTGMERDEENGFTYHGARYYAPWLGKWVSCDPAGLIDSSNLYCYSRSDPIRLYDPTGTTTIPEGYTVRGNPDKMFAENKNALNNWNTATNQVLESEFGKGSAAQNLAAYESKIDSLNDGPQQINRRIDLNSKKGFSRSIAGRILQQFYKNEAKSPSWYYAKNQFDLLKSGKAPDPLQQLEHTDPLAGNPKNLKAKDFHFTEGGEKGGVPKGSPHYKKHSTAPGSPGQRLANFRAKQGGVQSPPAAPAPTSGAPKAAPSPSTPAPAPTSGAPKAAPSPNTPAPEVKPSGGKLVGAVGLLTLSLTVIGVGFELYALDQGQDLTRKDYFDYVPGGRIITDFDALPEGFSSPASSTVFGAGFYEKKHGEIYKDGQLVRPQA